MVLIWCECVVVAAFNLFISDQRTDSRVTGMREEWKRRTIDWMNEWDRRQIEIESIQAERRICTAAKLMSSAYKTAYISHDNLRSIHTKHSGRRDSPNFYYFMLSDWIAPCTTHTHTDTDTLHSNQHIAGLKGEKRCAIWTFVCLWRISINLWNENTYTIQRVYIHTLINTTDSHTHTHIAT